MDLLTERAGAVVRYQGGNNAGHTVMFGNKTFILHMVPSGILRETTSILGNGVVIDLSELVREINDLEKIGIDVDVKTEQPTAQNVTKTEESNITEETKVERESVLSLIHI